jgi:hypothetical protein
MVPAGAPLHASAGDMSPVLCVCPFLKHRLLPFEGAEPDAIVKSLLVSVNGPAGASEPPPSSPTPPPSSPPPSSPPLPLLEPLPELLPDVLPDPLLLPEVLPLLPEELLPEVLPLPPLLPLVLPELPLLLVPELVPLPLLLPLPLPLVEPPEPLVDPPPESPELLHIVSVRNTSGTLAAANLRNDMWKLLEGQGVTA